MIRIVLDSTGKKLPPLTAEEYQELRRLFSEPERREPPAPPPPLPVQPDFSKVR